MRPASPEAYELLHDGMIALAEVEANGMRIDTDYLAGAISTINADLKRLERELRDDDIYDIWRKEFGAKTKLTAPNQRARIIYDKLGYECTHLTDKGSRSTDALAFSSIDLPFLRTLNKYDRLNKVKGTYLLNIEREVVDGRIHPFFNLHTTVTYRSSADRPNVQNQIKRDKKAAEIVRRCFIPSEGCCLIEADYRAIEVRIAACYHKDPVMLDYINDSTKDMHRDMAMICYKLPMEEIGDTMRDIVKNSFVFPEFYGDWYQHCAKNMWEAIDRYDLNTNSGVPLKEHLASVGIKKLGACDPEQNVPRPGTFEKHIKEVERFFWEKRFKIYAKWKRSWYDAYLKHGGFNTLTGFRIDGVYGRNDVINYPIQGSAFHCLLWALIRIQRWLRRNKMKTKIIGQIHDSILADVHLSEVDDYTYNAKRIMSEELRKAWPWIITPIDVSFERGDKNWFEKVKVKLA